jgi:hypothetical protein
MLRGEQTDVSLLSAAEVQADARDVMTQLRSICPLLTQ